MAKTKRSTEGMIIDPEELAARIRSLRPGEIIHASKDLQMPSDCPRDVTPMDFPDKWVIRRLRADEVATRDYLDRLPLRHDGDELR